MQPDGHRINGEGKTVINLKLSRRKERSGIGAQITKYRLDAGMTQTDLAKKMGVTCAMVSYLEIGNHPPKKKSIRKVCDALDITEACLYGIVGEWRIGQGGRMICPYCGRGQLRTKYDIEKSGYSLDQIRFCIFCGREVRADDD